MIEIILQGLKRYLLGYKQQNYLRRIKWHKQHKNLISPENIQCPSCGYYCLGKGGIGCIDKPTLCGYDLYIEDKDNELA